MDEIQIEVLRELCRDGNIEWTLHALKRLRERKISAESIEKAINIGEIIEQYQDDKPLPSCLLCSLNAKTPLHVVLGTDNKTIYVVTAYIPCLDEWENDYKTRKENK